MLIVELVPLAADGYCDVDKPGGRGCCQERMRVEQVSHIIVGRAKIGCCSVGNCTTT